MNAIVSVTADWGIGHAGELLIHNPVDLRRFAELTTSHAVVMGRVTLDSLPGSSPLHNRHNLVLTRRLSPQYANAKPAVPPGTSRTTIEYVHSFDELRLRIVELDRKKDDVWLIGGATVYRALLPCCRYAFVTRHSMVAPADAYFPNLDISSSWRCVSQSEEYFTQDGIAFRYLTYENLSP